MGFFTDSYDLLVISLITKLLGRIYYHQPGSSSPGSLPDGISAAVSGVAFAATGKAGRIGVKNSLIMLGVINFVGILFTFLFPEPKLKFLEELSGETKVEN